MSWTIFQKRNYILLIFIALLDCSYEMDINFTISENIPINTKVGDLSTLFGVLKINKPKIQIQYCDKNSFGIEFFYFNLSEKTINTNTEIDRESICSELSGTSTDCFINLGMTINQHLININIFVLDINDNSPKFLKPEVHYKILESEPIGFQLKLDQAIDLDSAKNGVFHYLLESSEKSHLDYFKLNRTISTLSLVIIKHLDYESVQKYLFHLIACDRGQPQLCSSQKLTIDIIDLNDETPRFLSKNYTKVVSEDLSIGSVILKVQAIDREAGKFGRVVYKLSNDQEFSTSYVTIDSDSGVISLRKPLLDIDKLSFTIVAYDSADHDPKFDWASVTILIIDINNHKPNISVGNAKRNNSNLYNENPIYILEMFENNPENIEVSFINIIDKDDGQNSDVKCYIKSKDNFISNVFYLDIRTRLNKYTFQYKLRLHYPIDRETISNPLALAVHCQDNGQPILHSTVQLKINILDQNEYPALFKKSKFSIPVYEETGNISILSFSVTDQDASTFNEFYLNSSNNFLVDKYFHLNSQTQSSGEITIFQPLDREKFDQINFFIFAINKAQDKKTFTSSTLIHIEIMDINDNRPEYIGQMTFGLKENNNPSAEIGELIFLDKDFGDNSAISLKSVSSVCSGPSEKLNQTNDFFMISNDKILKATKSFDYETTHKCQVVILFQDRGLPVLSNKITVTVNILDENDNDPKWIYPSEADNTVNVSQLNLKIGTRLTRVRAVDVDEISSDKLTYELKTKLTSISIDPISGEVVVTNDLDSGSYELFILVNDNGNPPRNSTANLTINIYSENLFHSINSITKAVLTIILIPAFVIIFSSGFFIFLVLFLRRRHQANVNFQCSKSAVVKNQNFSISTYKSGTRKSKDYDNFSPELMMTSLQNPYYYETDLEMELQNENENIPSNIAQLFLKKSMKPDCEVCSSADSGQGASEEEILLYNYKSTKPDKVSSQQLSNYLFPPLMEEDNNSYFQLNPNRLNKGVNSENSCNCYNEFVNHYAESEHNINILSLLQCPVHNQFLPLINNPNNVSDEYVCNPLNTSDYNGCIN